MRRTTHALQQYRRFISLGATKNSLPQEGFSQRLATCLDGFAAYCPTIPYSRATWTQERQQNRWPRLCGSTTNAWPQRGFSQVLIGCARNLPVIVVNPETSVGQAGYKRGRIVGIQQGLLTRMTGKALRHVDFSAPGLLPPRFAGLWQYLTQDFAFRIPSARIPAG